MFGSTDNKAKLEAKYAKLLEEAHRLSSSSRIKSDLKTAEANEVLAQIEELEKKG